MNVATEHEHEWTDVSEDSRQGEWCPGCGTFRSDIEDGIGWADYWLTTEMGAK